MERITIEFVAKELYQPRKDYKKETWFALSNTIMENPDYIDLCPYQFMALIYLYCQASKNKWGPTQITYRHAKKFHDIDADTLNEVIELLERNQKLTVIRTESVQNPEQSVQNLYAKDIKELKERTKQKKEHMSSRDPALQCFAEVIKGLWNEKCGDLPNTCSRTKFFHFFFSAHVPRHPFRFAFDRILGKP